jgi:hypothetical protein
VTATPLQPPTDREVLDRLVRIEIKLDTALSDVADHEARIRALEQGALTEERVATIADGRAIARQTNLRGWLTVILAALAILSASSTALLIAVFF